MKNKYNIALLPVNQSERIVQHASIFSSISDKYILGKNSLPHVTLCQFLAEPEEAAHIWQQVCESLEEKSINLFFKELSCISFDNQVFWVSLLPTHNEDLIKMHLQVAKIVKNPTNKSYQNYNPHITLMNTRHPDHPHLINKLSNIHTPFEDNFVISLGKSDDVGQYLEVIWV